jgi:hypothetical protein
MVSARNGIAPSTLAEVRWDFDGDPELAALQATIEILVVHDRGTLVEIARSTEPLQIGSALGRFIAVERRE